MPEGLVECLYWKKDNDNLEIYNIVDEEDFIMHGRLSKSCFHRIEIANNHLYGITDKFFSSIAAELYDDVIFCYDCPIVYDLNEKQFYLNIDIDGKWYNTLINSNTTVAAELEKIKNKMKELKDLNALGHLAFDLVQKYIFEDIDLEDLESCEKGFRELVEFYNKYYVNREAIYEKLDSNPVFKLLEVQVKEIFQEKEKNNQTLTRSKEL